MTNLIASVMLRHDRVVHRHSQGANRAAPLARLALCVNATNSLTDLSFRRAVVRLVRASHTNRSHRAYLSIRTIRSSGSLLRRPLEVAPVDEAAAQAVLGDIADLIDEDPSRDEGRRFFSPFELTAQVFDHPVPMPEPDAERGPMA